MFLSNIISYETIWEGEKPHKDNKNYFFIKRQFSQNVLLSVFKAARKWILY